MPTYDYICENCGYEFEHFQSISSEPIKTCPKCNKDTVVRKISGGTGLIFKGSGFYITDYSKKNSSPSSSSGSAKESKPEKKTAPKESTTSANSDS